MTQRTFQRYNFALPKEATLVTEHASEKVFLKDISIDGVCFMTSSDKALDLNASLHLNVEANLPERSIIEMKLLLVNIDHPIYHAMWNPTNEAQGITLLKWLKRLMGQENQFYC